MILWILLMGGLASEGNIIDQVWFIKTLANSCFDAGIVGTVELSLFLSDFLWSDFYISPAFKEFWDTFTVTQAAMTREVDKGG
jgi:hypothetical protein